MKYIKNIDKVHTAMVQTDDEHLYKNINFLYIKWKKKKKKVIISSTD